MIKYGSCWVTKNINGFRRKINRARLIIKKDPRQSVVLTKKINVWTNWMMWFTRTWTSQEVQRQVRVLQGKSADRKPTRKLIKRVTKRIQRSGYRIANYKKVLKNKTLTRTKREDYQRRLWTQYIIQGGRSWYNNRIKFLKNRIVRYRTLIAKQPARAARYKTWIARYTLEITEITRIFTSSEIQSIINAREAIKNKSSVKKAVKSAKLDSKTIKKPFIKKVPVNKPSRKVIKKTVAKINKLKK